MNTVRMKMIGISRRPHPGIENLLADLSDLPAGRLSTPIFGRPSPTVGVTRRCCSIARDGCSYRLADRCGSSAVHPLGSLNSASGQVLGAHSWRRRPLCGFAPLWSCVHHQARPMLSPECRIIAAARRRWNVGLARWRKKTGPQPMRLGSSRSSPRWSIQRWSVIWPMATPPPRCRFRSSSDRQSPTAQRLPQSRLVERHGMRSTAAYARSSGQGRRVRGQDLRRREWGQRQS